MSAGSSAPKAGTTGKCLLTTTQDRSAFKAAFLERVWTFLLSAPCANHGAWVLHVVRSPGIVPYKRRRVTILSFMI